MGNEQQEQMFTCGNISVTRMVIGPVQTNVYVVANEHGAFVIDPAEDADRILCAISQTPTKKLDAIVVTHAHFDHTGALARLHEQTGAPVFASAKDAPFIENPHLNKTSSLPFSPACVVDKRLDDGSTIHLCGITWQVLLTPGHTAGSMCLYAPQSECGGRCGMLFSGDTLFRGTHGRTDFEGGSATDMKQSLKRLSTLPNHTRVFPGHMEFSEIGAERGGVFAFMR